MPDKTYKLIEIVGVSDDSIQQAVRNGLVKASQTVRNIDWFEVTQIRGAVLNNQRPEFQVEMKVGFRLLDRSAVDAAKAGDAKAKKKKKK
jgi:dodecin